MEPRDHPPTKVPRACTAEEQRRILLVVEAVSLAFHQLHDESVEDRRKVKLYARGPVLGALSA